MKWKIQGFILILDRLFSSHLHTHASFNRASAHTHARADNVASTILSVACVCKHFSSQHAYATQWTQNTSWFSSYLLSYVRKLTEQLIFPMSYFERKIYSGQVFIFFVTKNNFINTRTGNKVHQGYQVWKAQFSYLKFPSVMLVLFITFTHIHSSSLTFLFISPPLVSCHFYFAWQWQWRVCYKRLTFIYNSFIYDPN